jgi:hypothetical protein
MDSCIIAININVEIAHNLIFEDTKNVVDKLVLLLCH